MPTENWKLIIRTSVGKSEFITCRPFVFVIVFGHQIGSHSPRRSECRGWKLGMRMQQLALSVVTLMDKQEGPSFFCDISWPFVTIIEFSCRQKQNKVYLLILMKAAKRKLNIWTLGVKPRTLDSWCIHLTTTPSRHQLNVLFCSISSLVKTNLILQ